MVKMTQILILTLSLVLFTACGGGSNTPEPTPYDTALAKIIAYADTQGGSEAPAVQDYADVNVVGVDDTNLLDINEAVKGLNKEDVDTTEEIQALVDALGVTVETSKPSHSASPSPSPSPSPTPPPSITHNGTTYGVVTSPYTGKVWLDRNLGAAEVCTSFNDTACYGDYYQWGRNFDGHQDSTSATTSTQATDVNSAGTDFITDDGTNNDDWANTADSDGSLRQANWSKTDGTSVCPTGFRVPTLAELRAELLDAGSAQIQNRDDAFNSFLKLPSAGGRGSFDGTMGVVAAWGHVWSSSASGTYASSLYFDSGSAGSGSYGYRAVGLSVRCLRD